MDDKQRELIIKRSAYGFIGCVCLLFFTGALFGKSAGRTILFTLIPAYSAYYVVMYRIMCKGYKDEVKKMYCYGFLGRGTFVGAIYYVSLMLILLISYLFIRVAYLSVASS